MNQSNLDHRVSSCAFLIRKYREIHNLTRENLADIAGFGKYFGPYKIKLLETHQSGRFDFRLWEKLCSVLEIPEAEIQCARKVTLKGDSAEGKSRSSQHRLARSLQFHLDALKNQFSPLGKVKQKEPQQVSLFEDPQEKMSIDMIIDCLLKGTENVKTISAKLGITERTFDRRYQTERRNRLNLNVFSRLSMSGFSDSSIAFAFGYTRQSLWSKKKEWGLVVNEGAISRRKSTHFRKGKATIETPWGLAYEYRRGYYLVRIKKGNPYWNHPIAPSHQCLLHRLIMLEHLLCTDPQSPCLTEINGVRTLHQNCHVHHINGDTSDNRLENLKAELKEAHIKKHWHGRTILKRKILQALGDKPSIGKEELISLLESDEND